MLNALVRLGCTFNRRILGTALLTIAANATMAVAATPQVKEGPVNVTIAGYSSGGQVSVFGEGVIDAVRRSYPDSSIIYEPGNPAGGLEYLRTGRRPFALESIVEPRMAYEGRAPFREAYPEGTITGVLNGAPDVFALKVYARKQFLDQHGITSFDDLIKKEIPMRVSVNQPGNLWAREHVRALLSYYGKTMEDIESWGGTLVPQPTGASNDLMRDGRLDVIITGGATPAGFGAQRASQARKRLGQQPGVSTPTCPASSTSSTCRRRHPKTPPPPPHAPPPHAPPTANCYWLIMRSCRHTQPT